MEVKNEYYYGHRFGMLMVHSKVSGGYLCECKCGKMCVKTTRDLKRSNEINVANCGCAANRLTGKGYDRSRTLLLREFDDLKVVALSDEIDKHGFSKLVCKCVCGNTVTKTRAFLIYNKHRSSRYRIDCGHKIANLDEKKRLKIIYASMKFRCYNENYKEYYNYGGKGITVCDEWRLNRDNFIKWALENGYKNGLTIERIDNDKGYCPENCTWISKGDQSLNRSNVFKVNLNGKLVSVIDIARDYKIPYSRILTAINNDKKLIDNFDLSILETLI